MYKYLSPKSLFNCISIVLLSYIVSVLLGYEKSPVVRISDGLVQGIISYSRDGRRYSQFLGIPFAKPPVGALRFEPPEPPLSWNGTLDARNYGADCLAVDFIMTGRVQGEESCLFLNVMTPAIVPGVKFKKLLPVMVYIFGGAFQMGTPQFSPPKFLMDEDVVYVSINYRLGIFGFLNTGDGLIKGNMGLKDQVLALKWVQSNIEAFGGDPNQVTLIGTSAGGGSAHFMMLSPMAKGLFHRAISSSCEALSDLWQFNRSHSEHIGYIGDYFGCSVATTQGFVDCLRAKDEDEMVSYHYGLITPKLYHNFAALGPSIEEDGPDAFLSENPLVMLKEGRIVNKVPWMAGVNQNEGYMILGKLLQFIDPFDLVNDDDLWADMLPHLIFYDPIARPDVPRRVKEHFFGNRTGVLTKPEILETIGELITEKMFFKPLMESSVLQSGISPVYLYYFSYKVAFTYFNVVRWSTPNSYIMPTELSVVLNYLKEDVLWKLLGWYHHYGGSHGDEVFMFFNPPGVFLTKEETAVSKIMVKMIAEFADLSKPIKFQNMDWPAVSPSGPVPLMHLKPEGPEVLQDPFKARLKFWKDLDLPRL